MSTVHCPLSTRSRVIFMGTPAFALPTLKALHASPHEVVAVYTQPPRPAGRGQKDTPSPVQHYADTHSLPVHTPVSLKSEEAQAQFRAHHADIAVVVAYGLLLPKEILEACPLGCINVHPSLLPRWRGAAPLQRTIMAGDKKTATVIMQMDVGLDTGDMLLVEPYDIAPGTNAGMLHDTLAERAAPLVLAAIEGLKNHSITPEAQPALGVKYAPKITKEECRIDWSRPAETIYHQMLGLAPSPGAYFSWQGENIKIFDARYSPAPVSQPPGTVLSGTLSIACNPGTLSPTLLQRPGKTRMTIDDFLRGFSIPPGSILV